MIAQGSRTRRLRKASRDGATADLPASTSCKKVNVPGDIASNITRIEGNYPLRCHEHEIHAKTPEHLDKFLPPGARLLQAIRPELKQKLEGRIFVQNAFCA